MQMERQLRKTKEKAIEKGKWAGRGGPKGSFRVSDQLPSGYDSDMEFPKDRKVLAKTLTGLLAHQSAQHKNLSLYRLIHLRVTRRSAGSVLQFRSCP